MLRGMTSQGEKLTETCLSNSLLTSWTMKNRQNPKGYTGTGNEETSGSFFGHCISGDTRMCKSFADFFSHRVFDRRSTCRKANFFMGQVSLFWDSTGGCYIYNLSTEEKFCVKSDLSTLCETLQARSIHACTKNVSTVAIAKLGCWLDQLNWQEVVNLLRDTFDYADVPIVV